MLEARVQLDAPIWTRSVLKVPKDLLANYLYIRPGSVPVGADQHVYDCGVFNLLANGAPVGVAGELFVSYKCKLRTPNGGAIAEGTFSGNGVSLAAPIGTSAFTADPATTIGVIWVDSTHFRFETPGTYYLIVRSTGTTITGGPTITPSGGNAALVTAINTGSATDWVREYEVNCTSVVSPYAITAPAGAATVTAFALRVFKHDLSMAP